MMSSKKRTLLISVLLVFVLFALASCATVGKKFPVDNVTKIQIGKTTQSEISQLFGPPWRTGIEDGNETWTYGYYKYRLFGQSSTTDLVVRYRANGIVDSYSFNTTDTGEK